LASVKFISVTAFVLVGACAPPDPVRSAQASSVTQANAETVLEGTMEVLIEDSDQGSRTLYFLMSGNRRVPLRFISKPPNLTTGTRVRVRGRWEKDDTLVVTAIDRI
jgi:hypothetical protein